MVKLREFLFLINDNGINYTYLSTNNDTFPESYRKEFYYYAALWLDIVKNKDEENLGNKIIKRIKMVDVSNEGYPIPYAIEIELENDVVSLFKDLNKNYSFYMLELKNSILKQLRYENLLEFIYRPGIKVDRIFVFNNSKLYDAIKDINVYQKENISTKRRIVIYALTKTDPSISGMGIILELE